MHRKLIGATLVLALLAGCNAGSTTGAVGPDGAPPPAAPATQAAVAGDVASRTHAAHLPAAYHEFQVFGDRAIYLSHYPMFASIHAYQVILEARLMGENGQDAERIYREFRAAHPDRGLTLSPSIRNGDTRRQRHDWVLPAEIRAGGRFNADLHWVADPEQFANPDARQYVARNVTVEITRVLRFQMFYPDTARSPELAYLAFGRDGEWWLAHRLELYPDFDHVVRANLTGATPPADGLGVIRFPGRTNAAASRLQTGAILDGILEVEGAQPRPIRVNVTAEQGFEELHIQE